MHIRLLGPAQAWHRGREVALGPPKQRAVLGFLAGRVGEEVSLGEIVDAVWGSDLPNTPAGGVHTYIARLRRVLEPERTRGDCSVLTSTAGGYALRIDAANVDARAFEDRCAEAWRANEAGDARARLGLLQSALNLWEGDAYADVPGPFAASERARLQEIRLTGVEDWAECMLDLGRHAEVAEALSELVAGEPLREKPRALLMLAMHRSGRRAEALACYRETRELLRAELGLEPGAELRTLQRQILAGEPGAFPAHSRPTRSSTAGLSRPGPARPDGMPRPAQLPPTVRGFFGRAQELQQLHHIVRLAHLQDDASPQTLVLEGTANVGKTALALSLAHDVADAFPDGQLFLDMCGTSLYQEPLDAHEALGRLLLSMGVEESQVPAPFEERRALYRSLLHGRRVLLLVDDVARAEDVLPLAPPGPACLLVTSRWRQSGLEGRGVHRTTLRPLRTEESIDLLAYLVGAERLAREPQAVRGLVRECGHLPLPLRICAEELRADPQLSVATLLKAVEYASLDELAVVGDSTASMRISFRQSYRKLSTEAARIFRLLGLYEGSDITVSVASVLAGLGPAPVRCHMEELVAAHLLEPVSRDRYRFYGLFRAYAAECAEAEPSASRTAALSRMILWSAQHGRQLCAVSPR